MSQNNEPKTRRTFTPEFKQSLISTVAVRESAISS